MCKGECARVGVCSDRGQAKPGTRRGGSGKGSEVGRRQVGRYTCLQAVAGRVARRRMRPSRGEHCAVPMCQSPASQRHPRFPPNCCSQHGHGRVHGIYNVWTDWSIWIDAPVRTYTHTHTHKHHPAAAPELRHHMPSRRAACLQSINTAHTSRHADTWIETCVRTYIMLQSHPWPGRGTGGHAGLDTTTVLRASCRHGCYRTAL